MAALLLLALVGCAEPAAPPPPCPERAAAPERLPGVWADELDLDHWLALWTPGELDRPLLDPAGIEAHDRALAERGRGGRGPEALLEVPERGPLLGAIAARLGAMEESARGGELVRDGGARLSIADLRALRAPPELPPLAPAVRVALGPVAIRCSPLRAPLRRGDPRFDRNLCSTLVPQEPVQVLLPWHDGTLLVRTPYVLGWLESEALLGPPLGPEDAGPYLTAPRALEPPSRAPLPVAGERLMVATERGLEPIARPAGAIETRRPLTRRAWLEAAFAHLGEPYGWGGEGGGLDCSQLTQEVLASFDLHLPRNSAEQAEAGTSSIELSPGQSDASRLRALDLASARGVVLLVLPGHVMIHLGRSRDRPMVLHALAEYVEPCPRGGETLRLVDRVVVSELSLGEGSSRGSLLRRITRIVVFGPEPGTEGGPSIPPAGAGMLPALEGGRP